MGFDPWKDDVNDRLDDCVMVRVTRLKDRAGLTCCLGSFLPALAHRICYSRSGGFGGLHGLYDLLAPAEAEPIEETHDEGSEVV